MGKLGCLSPITLKDQDGFQQLVQCNHCINCSIRRQLGWSLRICLEQRSTGSACFITNTYNEDQRIGRLHYPHIQRFLKRFRKSFGKPVRFFSCGQYGTKHGREHWHTILFNVTPAEAADQFRTQLMGIPGRSLQGLQPQATALWPHGSTHIGEVNISSARYVARYVLRTGDKDDERQNVVQMSRRPGIGLGELERIGHYLADVKPVWEATPGWWKVNGSLYPLDSNAREKLEAAFIGRGGTILQRDKSALMRHSEARMFALAGDLLLPGAAVKLERIIARDMERSPF